MNEEDFKKLFKFICIESDKDTSNEALSEATYMIIDMANNQESINEVYAELGWV